MSAVMREIEKQIVEFDEFELKLKEFKEKYDDVVYDLTIPEQEKQARSDKHSIGKVLSKLDAVHKTLKAPLKEKVDLIDGRRKEIKDELLGVQGKIKEQIKAHEQAVEDHANELQKRVDDIRMLGVFQEHECINAAHLRNRLNELKEIKVDDTYEDRKADAFLAQAETIKALKSKLAERIKYDEEQAELERLRKESEERERADREEQIRKDAEEKARLEAEEKAEREKESAAAAAQKIIDDAKQAQQEAEDAEARAKAESRQAAEKAAAAERERIARENEEKERKEKIERDKEEARKAKQEHRRKIQSEALKALTLNGVDEGLSKQLIQLIDEGKIEHISINY